MLPALASAQLRADVYVAGLEAPVAFVQDPAHDHLQFIVEQPGRIRVVDNGVLLDAPFLDLTSAVVNGGERGLLGMAVAPDYADSRRFFVNFTGEGGHTVIARFTRSASDPRRADPASRFDLVFPDGHAFIRQPFENHNGGDLHFGPDGYLYIAMGDGGSGNDPTNQAQDMTSLLGKMLRIDVAVPDTDPIGYRVPPDNPFHLGTTVTNTSLIWAKGLRNPWRFTFDHSTRGGTDALIIADVGQASWEEVNYEPRGRGGRNYGWRIREGAHRNPLYDDTTSDVLTDPVIAYTPNVGRSVIGGVMYRGQDLDTSLSDRYVFGDFTGRVWSAHFVLAADGEVVSAEVQEHTEALGGPARLGLITAFGIDSACRVYVVNLSGTVFRISSDPGHEPGCEPPAAVPRTACGSTNGDDTPPCPTDVRRPRGGGLTDAWD
jgi:glucose/arabinose dehydrogenase